jgi:hypothetical protein
LQSKSDLSYVLPFPLIRERKASVVVTTFVNGHFAAVDDAVF